MYEGQPVKPLHYQGRYHVQARHVRQAANNNPNTRCWRCGLTLQQHAPHKSGQPAKWTAGHLIDSDPTSPLLPEASTCNYKAGARHGNAQRTDLTW